jgi:hypothetical protein
MGVTLVVAAVIVTLNLVVDLVLVALDPRVAAGPEARLRARAARLSRSA